MVSDQIIPGKRDLEKEIQTAGFRYRRRKKIEMVAKDRCHSLEWSVVYVPLDMTRHKTSKSVTLKTSRYTI